VELERIVLRCLEKRPNLRFPSVEALAQALDAEKGTLISRLDNFSSRYRTDANQSLNLILSQVREKGKIINISQYFTRLIQFYLFVNLFRIPTQNELTDKSSNYLSSNLHPPMLSKLSIINSKLIDQCKVELSIHIGPIASLIIEQTINDAQYHQPQKFIEALASQIPDMNAARNFRQAFLA
jgi:hypothetical protein